MKKKTLARQTAELIAADLFDYGCDVKVTRLVMEIPDSKRPLIDAPGWCQEAVADRIEEVLLRKHLGVWIDKKKKALKKG